MVRLVHVLSTPDTYLLLQCSGTSTAKKLYLTAHDVHISQVNDRPDQPLWFCGQMFEAGWIAKNLDEHPSPVEQ
jgi:hypothetical protein